MEIGVPGYHGRDGEAGPVVATGGEAQKGGEEREDPELAEYAVKGALVEVLAAVGYGEHQDDLEHCTGDAQHLPGLRD